MRPRKRSSKRAAALETIGCGVDVVELARFRQAMRRIGLAVPAMPPGSPGMESEHPVSYDTLLVGKDGKAKVFARH